MKIGLKILVASAILLCLFAAGIPHANTWGFFAHKQLNRIACFTLPDELIGFYKTNIEFVTEHAVDPDKRRYAVTDEAARHFIDLDRYGQTPLDSIPKKWEDAVKNIARTP